MAAALGLPVLQHDDGSSERQHDLEVIGPDGTSSPVEVTAAADGESIALWKLMNGTAGRWIDPGICGGWFVGLLPGARAKRLRRELPGLLAMLEELGATSLDPRPWGRHDLEVIGMELGIEHAQQSATGFPGSIYITVVQPNEQRGGFVPDSGDALAEWIGGFLGDARRRDVLQKLAATGAEDRHAFVLVPGFSTAPFEVIDLTMRDGAPAPRVDPELPPAVTDVWVASSWLSGHCFHWSHGSGWQRFEKVFARSSSARERETAP